MLITSGQRDQTAASAMRDRSSSGFVLPISMTLSPDQELTTELKKGRSLLHVRVPLRKAIATATIAALGSALACVALLGVRGDLHLKSARQAPVENVEIVEIVAVDAPWTPLPRDAKPWKPAPYAPIQSRNE